MLLHAIQHLAEDDAAHAGELSCKFHLHQHAIYLKRFGAYIFDKQDGVISPGCVLRTDRRGQHGETSAVESSFGVAGDDGLDARARHRSDLPLRLPFQRRLPTGHMQQIGGIVEVARDHGTMERNQVGEVREPRQQRGDIAVAHEDLRVLTHNIEIEFLQQVVAAVTAARTDDRLDLGSAEHLLQLAGASLDRPSKVKVLLEDGIEEEGLVTHAKESEGAGVEEISLDRACRSDDANRIARHQRRRFDPRIRSPGIRSRLAHVGLYLKRKSRRGR